MFNKKKIKKCILIANMSSMTKNTSSVYFAISCKHRKTNQSCMFCLNIETKKVMLNLIGTLHNSYTHLYESLKGKKCLLSYDKF